MRLITKKVQRKLGEYTLLKDFSKKYNKVLINRGCGGAGDILMHRMIFEDFKLLMPECHLTFACPPQFFELTKNHPFVDEVVNTQYVNKDDYAVCYDTSFSCLAYEVRMQSKTAPDKNRPDIWAESCGLNLTKHNMHLNLDTDIVRNGKDYIKAINKDNLPTVLLAPFSMAPDRCLTSRQIEFFVKGFRDRGFFVYTTHLTPNQILNRLDVFQFYGLKIRDWLGIVNAADYVVSVDTSVFHIAGGLKKPLLGIFHYIDGKVRGDCYDFVLTQLHRDNGDWNCGPCWMPHQCRKQGDVKPCSEIPESVFDKGIEELLNKWKVKH